MTYNVPLGFCRVQVDFAPAGALGSTPTFGFGVGAAPSSDLMDAIEGWLDTEYKPRLGNNWTITGIRMYDNTTAFLRPVTMPGQFTGAQSPPSCAMLVSTPTALRGRANRGRIYLPGVLNDSQTFDDGTIGASYVTEWQGLIDDLRDAIEAVTDGADLVVLHTTSSDPTPVNGAIVQGVIATQRRRVRK